MKLYLFTYTESQAHRFFFFRQQWLYWVQHLFWLRRYDKVAALPPFKPLCSFLPRPLCSLGSCDYVFICLDYWNTSPFVTIHACAQRAVSTPALVGPAGALWGVCSSSGARLCSAPGWSSSPLLKHPPAQRRERDLLTSVSQTPDCTVSVFAPSLRNSKE